VNKKGRRLTERKSGKLRIGAHHHERKGRQEEKEKRMGTSYGLQDSCTTTKEVEKRWKKDKGNRVFQTKKPVEVVLFGILPEIGCRKKKGKKGGPKKGTSSSNAIMKREQHRSQTKPFGATNKDRREYFTGKEKKSGKRRIEGSTGLAKTNQGGLPPKASLDCKTFGKRKGGFLLPGGREKEKKVGSQRVAKPAGQGTKRGKGQKRFYRSRKKGSSTGREGNNKGGTPKKHSEKKT